MGDFFCSVDDLEFRRKIQQYQRLTGKAIGDVLKEQAKLLAQRLMSFTYPKSASQGKKRVAIDIGRVYLQNEWFTEIFKFTNQKLQDRILKLVWARNESDLFQIFLHSPKLSRLHIEPFNPNRHEQARKNGRVNYPQPFSFPLNDQQKVKSYASQEKKKVGLAKSGWGVCFKLLGGSPPAWLSRSVGSVEDKSDSQSNPYIKLTNHVSYFGRLNQKADIVVRAMAGRGNSMILSAKRQLRQAAQDAGLT